MKTKVLKMFGAAAVFAVAAFVSVSVSTDNGVQDVTLADLANATEANAECKPFKVAHGLCLVGSQTCVFDTSAEKCDPYSM